MRVLLTGASGFVGSGVAHALSNYDLTLIGRRHVQSNASYLKEINGSECYSDCLSNIDVVIHCAARVHVMKDVSQDPLGEYRKVNVAGTLNLARQAAELGVKRFIFLSSIKVNGECTRDGQPFRANDTPSPQDAYSKSKYEAEQGLQSLAAETGMELVIIRPPLVFGHGVKGNFATLLKLLEKKVPLPLGAVNNSRSFVALDNLIDLVVTCIDHPKAANQIFLVSDDHDLSTTELLELLGRSSGNPSRLIPMPESWIKFGAGVLGKPEIADRLFSSLQVDISHTKKILDWQPPVPLEEAMFRYFSIG